MSRLSKKPIDLLGDVKFEIGQDCYTFSGKLGSINVPVFRGVSLSLSENQIVASVNDNKQSSELSGLLHSLVKNAMVGVSQGHQKVLELKGLGYRCSLNGTTLILSLGYSHKINFSVPSDITLTVEKDTIITIKGINKQRVGQVAAEIRAFRIPDNYHAKGILYQGEVVITKEGKKK